MITASFWLGVAVGVTGTALVAAGAYFWLTWGSEPYVGPTSDHANDYVKGRRQ